MKIRLAVLCLLAGLLPGSAVAAELEWTVTPYLFGSRVSGDLTVNGTSSELSADFGDILDRLEFGGMVRVSAMGERWGMSFDASHMSLGQASKIGDTQIDFDQTVLEIAGIRQLRDHLDLVFGLRSWDLDSSIDFDLPAFPDASKDIGWVDPFVGVRLRYDLGADWRFLGRADVGGFNVGSDISWNAEIAFGWRAHERFELWLGYRVLDVDYSGSSAPTEDALDLTFAGPAIGFSFLF